MTDSRALQPWTFNLYKAMKRLSLKSTLVFLLIVGFTAMPSQAQKGKDGVRTLKGTLTFFANYTVGGGQIPSGDGSALPYLYLCAFDQRGKANDFTHKEENDVRLGCVRADEKGNYTLHVRPEEPQLKLYLVTFLCDEDDTGSTSKAEVCVRRNRAEGKGKVPQSRKQIWSQTYGLTLASQPVALGWNLSCPNKSGLGLPTVLCDSSGDDQPAPAKIGAINSNAAYNREAVHAFRAAVEPIKTYGTMKPHSTSTFNRLCLDEACQDEINLVIAGTEVDGQDRYLENCLDDGGNNASGKYDRVCLTTPTNPFRVVHEIGHNVHRRWMAYEGPLARDANDKALDCDGWDEDEDPKCATSEGWANFFSSASWFNENMNAPTYVGLDIEDASTLQSCEDAPLSEGHTAQFFWDLWDAGPGGNDDDAVNMHLTKLRKVWSAFGSGTGNRDNNETGDDGRNAQDFLYWYNTQYGSSPEVDAVVAANCIGQHPSN